jgi:hypothetical protein
MTAIDSLFWPQSLAPVAGTRLPLPAFHRRCRFERAARVAAGPRPTGPVRAKDQLHEYEFSPLQLPRARIPDFADEQCPQATPFPTVSPQTCLRLVTHPVPAVGLGVSARCNPFAIVVAWTKPSLMSHHLRRNGRSERMDPIDRDPGARRITLVIPHAVLI